MRQCLRERSQNLLKPSWLPSAGTKHWQDTENSANSKTVVFQPPTSLPLLVRSSQKVFQFFTFPVFKNNVSVCYFFLNILTNQVSPSVATLILVKCTLISCQLLDDANCFTRNLKSICRSLSWFLGLLVQLWGVRLFVCSTNLFRLRSLHSRQRENVSWNIKQTVPKRC